ncbi:NAD-dependent epimerase/dehydratase family protein, partial [Candidatus Saccharibacteria bacterium]|nr:NAD-dependent epimerase/dehydratase family protein [Candidatus Saccharibacteria bacterium]
AKKKNKSLNIYGNGKQVRDALFGTDLAKLYLEQLENIKKHQGQVYNVGGGPKHTVSLLEVIDYLNQ